MRLTLSKDLYYGKDVLGALKTLTGKKTITVVGGGSMKRFGFLDKVVDYLKEAGMEVKSLEGAESDSSADTVLKGIATMQELEPDWIVVMGGGSPIDATKVIRMFYEYPDASFEDLVISLSFPTLRTKAKPRAISSTLGIATEVAVSSAITDYKKGIKYPLADFNITPDVAIMDPALAETMSGELTAHIGMDAMTHVIEAYVSTFHCEYMDPLALHAIEMISEYLIPSYNGDTEVRDKIHNAQRLAGMTPSGVLLEITHSMAHETDAAHSGGHTAHGCANAMYLPKVIKFNSKGPKAAAGYAKVAKSINLPGTTEEGLTGALIARLLEMNKVLDIPACIKDYEGGIIDEKELMDKLPKVTELAVGDAYTGPNPRSITPRVMEQLLKCCYHGEEVDF